MVTYTITVSKSALNKIVKAGIKHKVISEPNALLDLLMDQVPNMSELNEYDQCCILEEAITAHSQGLSLEVDIYLGRDCNDHRNYTYRGCIKGSKYPDVTFTQLDQVI